MAAASTQRIPNNIIIEGDLTVQGTLPSYARTSLVQDDLKPYPLHLERWRVWDAYQTALGTAAADDLGIGTGTFATGTPYISAGDLKAAGATTRRARILFQLPPEYVAGQTVRLNAWAGMVTTVADTSCTVDFECYRSDADTTIGGSDLVTTSATSMNSLTFAAKAFDVTATSLAAGDWLDIRMTIVCTDTATVTAVIPAVAHAEVILDIKG